MIQKSGYFKVLIRYNLQHLHEKDMHFKSVQLSFASAVVIVNYLSLGLEKFPSECNASETQKVSHSGIRLPSQQISPPILRVHGSVALQSVLSETLNTTAFNEEKPI